MAQPSSYSLVVKDLPLLAQLQPDLLHEDMVGSKEEVERAVGVVEPVQQHLGHLLLLLLDQPRTEDWLGPLIREAEKSQRLYLLLSSSRLCFASIRISRSSGLSLNKTN